LATGLSIDYWYDHIRIGRPSDLAYDRHLLRDSAMFLKNFSPFIHTYALELPGTKLGRHTFNRGSPQPLKFTGDYSTSKVESYNELFFTHDMQDDMLFNNGLFYINPKVNWADGLMGMECNGGMTGDNVPISDEIPLVDGRVFKFQDLIADVIWRDNHDIIPTSGDLRSVRACTVLLGGVDAPSWIVKGEYEIRVGKYMVTRKLRDEQFVMGKTRTDLIIASQGVRYNEPRGGDRPKIRNEHVYYTKWKKYTLKRAKRRVETNERFWSGVTRMVRAQLKGVSFGKDIGVEGKEDAAKEEVKELVNNVLDLRSRMETMITDGEYSVNDKFIKLWQKVRDTLLRSSQFYFVTDEDVKDATKIDPEIRQVLTLRYGAGRAPRKWDEEVMMAEMQILGTVIDDAISQTIETYTQMVSMTWGPDTADLIYSTVAKATQESDEANERGIVDTTVPRTFFKPRSSAFEPSSMLAREAPEVPVATKPITTAAGGKVDPVTPTTQTQAKKAIEVKQSTKTAQRAASTDPVEIIVNDPNLTGQEKARQIAKVYEVREQVQQKESKQVTRETEVSEGAYHGQGVEESKVEIPSESSTYATAHEEEQTQSEEGPTSESKQQSDDVQEQLESGPGEEHES
jgi:hypothetical protein